MHEQSRPNGPHSGHPLIAIVRAGNFCGKRLETHIVRCTLPVCRGAFVTMLQRPIRAGQRPKVRKSRRYMVNS